jgi:hypothetical protein
VALAAIQGLNQKMETRENEIAELRRELGEIKTLLRQFDPRKSEIENKPKSVKVISAIAATSLLITTTLFQTPAVRAAAVISDGSKGVFHPVGDCVINLAAEAPDGVLNYTTIHIPAGVTVYVTPNATNTPVFLAATGDVLIEGTIYLSASHYYATHPLAGGEYAGPAGAAGMAGSNGFGPGGGFGGPPPAIYLDTTAHGNGGGGGGMATPGRTATSRTGPTPGAGGPAIPRPVLTPGVHGGGGASGGGGSGIFSSTVPIRGGDGGAGGGALQISTPGKLTITGSLLANGGHAEAAYGNGLGDSAGPGGGGAGGNIELYADTLELRHATIEEIGGLGGGLFSEPVSQNPFLYNSGATGGMGYLFVAANSVLIDSATVIAAVSNISRPNFSTLSLQGGHLVFTGTGGTNQIFEVLTSTNVTLALANWTPFQTNVCDASGNFIFTNAVTPADAQRFFLLRGH